MIKIESGETVPPIPTNNGSLFSEFGKMVPGDYTCVVFKTMADCSKNQKGAHIAMKRNGFKSVTRKKSLSTKEFVLQVWCIESFKSEKPD